MMLKLSKCFCEVVNTTNHRRIIYSFVHATDVSLNIEFDRPLEVEKRNSTGFFSLCYHMARFHLRPSYRQPSETNRICPADTGTFQFYNCKFSLKTEEILHLFTISGIITYISLKRVTTCSRRNICRWSFD